MMIELFEGSEFVVALRVTALPGFLPGAPYVAKREDIGPHVEEESVGFDTREEAIAQALRWVADTLTAYEPGRFQVRFQNDN